MEPKTLIRKLYITIDKNKTGFNLIIYIFNPYDNSFLRCKQYGPEISTKGNMKA